MTYAVAYIIKFTEITYILELDHRIARVVDGSLKLTVQTIAPFEWTILRGAPSPRPIGYDNFG